jgi:hypothetical protein
MNSKQRLKKLHKEKVKERKDTELKKLSDDTFWPENLFKAGYKLHYARGRK